MVLIGIRASLIALSVVIAGCGPVSGPRIKLPARQEIAVAMALETDESAEVLDAPDAFRDRLHRLVAERNFEPRPLDHRWDRVRLSKDRLAVMAQRSEARYLLLVEARASFYAQLAGKFRWTVTLRASLGRRGEEPLTTDFELPVILDFDHERAREALAASGAAAMQRLGPFLDRFLEREQAVRDAALSQAADQGGQARQAVVPGDYDAIYFVLIDRFANGDRGNDGVVDASDLRAFHGGDLDGVRARLDWIQELGFRTIWLSPIFAMRDVPFEGHGAFHGYWVNDPAAIEERFGGRRALAALSEEVRRRRMRLYLDLVVNHVDWDAPVRAAHPGWFHRRGTITDWNDPAQLTDGDVHGLPDLAQEEPDVYAWIVDSAKKVLPWTDGFRLDGVKHVPLPFWSRFNAEIAASAGGAFGLVGELLDGDPRVLARALREGNFTALFDFPLYYAMVDVFCKGRPAGRLAAALAADRRYDDPSRLVTFLDNHDHARILSSCDGNLDKVAHALAFQLTARGTPALTYGTEVGLVGTHEPANRGDMRFDADHPLRARIRELLELRRRHPALVRGHTIVTAFEGDRLVTTRLLGDDAVEIAIEHGKVSIRPVPAAGVVVPSGTRRVEITVDAPPVVGDSLRVIGAAPELGEWDPARAPEVHGGRVVVALPVGAVEPLKLAIRRRDGHVTWQEGDDRYLFVAPGEGPLAARFCWTGACRQ
ncbi:MAG: glycosyl hydrolase [Deltaproteobacteria bacterium]|nr:glycosyl hydrolase [Deltaproteobacteria bacterium]